MKIGNFEINRSNIQLLLIIGLLAVVTWQIIFDKSDGKELRNQSEDRVEQLEKDLEQIQKDKKAIIDSLIYYRNQQKEWDETDSLRSVELEEAKEKSAKYLAEKQKAERERKRAIKDLEEFKKNPPKVNDPIDLIRDTKKRLEN